MAIQPGSMGAWKLAARPPTLTAAVAPVLVGTGVAIGADEFAWVAALAALIGAICLQIGANFANDLFDYQRGADTHERLGPPRAAQMGLLNKRQLRLGMFLVFGVAMLAGIYLVYAAGWVIVAVGVASIIGALIYTGGPWPAGYHALGDLMTFVYFGVIAVVGTYFVQAGEVSGAAWWASLPMGFTVTAILVVNNLRDIATDRTSGKFTSGVLLGDRGTRWWYTVTIVAPFVVALAAWPLGFANGWVLLTLASAPVAFTLVRDVLGGREGRALNLTLKATARFDLLFGALFAVGLALS